MKILRIANGIYPEKVGGIEVSVHRLSKMQTEEGHDVTVLLPYANDKDGDTPDFCSIKHYDPKVRLFGNPLSPYPYQFIRNNIEEIDVIHTHSHLFSGSVYAARAANVYDIPFIVTSHGFESQTAPMYVNIPYNQTFGRYVFKSADEILTYTSTEVKKLEGLGIPKEKIQFVQRGIDVDACLPNFDKPTNPVQLLWVSRFAPGKGAHIVVEALHELEKRGVNVEATLVGEGPQRNEVEELIDELGVADSITIKDFMPQQDLYTEYSQATLFVLPSVSEGMNRTLLESMASGTPVVISDLPHFRDVIDDCGRIVPELKGEAFADGIEEMLDGDLSRMSEMARERIKGQFTWEHTFDDIRPIFNRVVSK